MEPELLDRTERLIAARTPDEAWDHAVHGLRSFGLDGVFYGRKCRSKPQIRMSEELSSWSETYFAHEDHRRDPLFRYADSTPTQFFTGVSFLHKHPYLEAEDHAVIGRAADHGWRSGFAVQGHADEAGCGGWNLMSRRTRSEFRRLITHRQSAIALICALAERAMSREAKTGMRLTKREHDCLSWLAAGLRNDQIAHRLGIRPVTVELHLRNARKRLNARTREQALAIAIVNGLITP